MSERHKHADLIIAWANGAEIEIKTKNFGWVPFGQYINPLWAKEHEYRIKPKPPVVKFAYMNISTPGIVWRDDWTTYENVKGTFDPDTGKLLSVEMI